MGVPGTIGEPERVLQPESLVHDCAIRNQPVVERGGLLASALRQGFVGEGHHEAAFVVLRRLDRTPFGRRELAEAGDVHSPYVDRGLAVDHPLGDAAPDTAALAEARHDAHRDPVVPHPRHRADQGVAVGAEGEGAADDVLDPRLAERRDTLERHLQPVGDAVEIGRQQLLTEVERRAGDVPRGRLRLVGPEQDTLPFLPEIDVGLVVGAARQAAGTPLPHPLDDRRDRLGNEVVVLHRLNGSAAPAISPTSRAQSPPQFTTYSAWTVPRGVTTSHEPSDRWFVSTTGVCVKYCAPCTRADLAKA